MKHRNLTKLLVLLTFLTPGAALAADAAAGQKVFRKCAACHTVDVGKNKLGPSLAGVVGRKAGSVAGFKYSKAVAAAGAEKGLVWSEQNLDAYLTKPKDFLPGNKMPFPGLKNPEDRANVIAFLKSVAAN